MRRLILITMLLLMIPIGANAKVKAEENLVSMGEQRFYLLVLPVV